MFLCRTFPRRVCWLCLLACLQSRVALFLDFLEDVVARFLFFFFANFEAIFLEGYLSSWSRKFYSICSKQFSSSAPWREASAGFRWPTGIWRHWNACPSFLEATVLASGPQSAMAVPKLREPGGGAGLCDCARASSCQTLLLVTHLCLTVLGSCWPNIGQNYFLQSTFFFFTFQIKVIIPWNRRRSQTFPEFHFPIKVATV